MNSRLWLTFTDKDLLKDFTEQRNKEITIFSVALLIARFIFGLVLLSQRIQGAEISLQRVILVFAGQLWHLVSLLLGYRFPHSMQRYQAPHVIVSYGLYVFNVMDPQVSSNDMLSNMIVLYLILFTSSIFISSNWVLTNLSTLTISIGTVVYYRFQNMFQIS